jgi:peptidyl-prolyl cis-trans isomerase D
MLKFLQKRGRGARIVLGFVGVALGGAMLITLVPGSIDSPVQSADAVATVGDRTISMAEVRQGLTRMSGGRQIPPALMGIYAEQVIDQLVFGEMLELEAERMGITVTRQEQADLIRRLLPGAQAGNMEQYAAEVNERFQLTVPVFENLIRRDLLQTKISQLITDGVTVTPEELEREFRRRNEKIKIEYAVIRPDTLEAQVRVDEADLNAYFEKNKSKYQVPERRRIRFALLDLNQLHSRVSVTDEDLRAFYNEHVDRFQVQNRAKVSHILFKTVGKTDAEVEEIRRKAEDILKKARGGAKFDELARTHSEDDATKPKGGDLGWIVAGQTVPEFEHAAFNLPKGRVSDLVKTQYGFHIIRVEDREQAHTQSFEEVRESLRGEVFSQKSRRTAEETADAISSAVRLDTRKRLDDVAREFGMTISEAGPAGVRELWGELGFGQEIDDAVFRLRPNELSTPLRLERGYVVLELKESLPAHQGTLDEVRAQVLTDYRREKAGELAKAKAEELAAKLQGGAALAAAARAAGLDVKTSEPFARTGTVPDIGNASALAQAFTLAPGQAGPATTLGSGWVVYRVLSREGVRPEELAQQMRSVQEAVLQRKREIAYAAFRDALQERMIREGVLRYNEENRKRLMASGGGF